MKNYYQVLGLESHASKEEIKKAYRTYASKFHPDKQNGDKFFEERFKEILEAYEILSDDNKRANYDFKSKNNSSQSSSHYKQSYSKSEEDLKRERERQERERQERERQERERQERERQEKIRKEKEERIRNENIFRENKKREIEEKNKRKKSKIFYTSKNLIVNGMYIYKDNKTYLLDDYDFVVLRKDDSSSSILYCIFLIIIGFIGITTFIGIVFLLGGIAGLFLREYIVVLANEKGDFPLVKGKKMKMKKIVKRIEQAKSDTGDEI